MSDTATATALAQAADALRAEARAHKRAEAHHRRQARALMQAADNFRTVLEQHRIRMHIQP